MPHAVFVKACAPNFERGNMLLHFTDCSTRSSLTRSKAKDHAMFASAYGPNAWIFGSDAAEIAVHRGKSDHNNGEQDHAKLAMRGGLNSFSDILLLAEDAIADIRGAWK